MCNCRKGERVRQFDLFGVPVGVTYNKEPVYKTGLGGIVTIFISVYFIYNLLTRLLSVIVSQKYTVQKSDQYNLYSIEQPDWVLSTADTTVFGSIGLDPDQHFKLPENYAISDFFRVMFYSRVLVDGIAEVHWHNATLCSSLYGDMIEDNVNGIAQEFDFADWICPDLETFSISNDPATFRSADGISLNLVVNDCKDAKRIDEENNLSSYNGTYNCYDFPNEIEFDDLMAAVNFRSKFMSQDAIDPEHYSQFGETDVYFSNRISTYGVPSFGQIFRVKASQQSVSF